MKVNIIFEDSEYVDIIEIPYNIIELEKIQSDFFKWIFDKNIEHKYWIIENGEKKYCSYGTDAFIYWLNNTILKDSIENAYILKNNTSNYNENDKSLYF